jgi:hybrid cluster-associated redox disulfide protein
MMKKKITKNTKLSEILKSNKKAAELLFREGLSCIGCPMAMEETLGEGCLAHGMSEKQVDDLLKKINKE